MEQQRAVPVEIRQNAILQIERALVQRAVNILKLVPASVVRRNLVTMSLQDNQSRNVMALQQLLYVNTVTPSSIIDTFEQSHLTTDITLFVSLLERQVAALVNPVGYSSWFIEFNGYLERIGAPHMALTDFISPVHRSEEKHSSPGLMTIGQLAVLVASVDFGQLELQHHSAVYVKEQIQKENQRTKVDDVLKSNIINTTSVCPKCLGHAYITSLDVRGSDEGSNTYIQCRENPAHMTVVTSH